MRKGQIIIAIYCSTTYGYEHRKYTCPNGLVLYKYRYNNL